MPKVCMSEVMKNRRRQRARRHLRREQHAKCRVFVVIVERGNVFADCVKRPKAMLQASMCCSRKDGVKHTELHLAGEPFDGGMAQKSFNSRRQRRNTKIRDVDG